jgi:hypothetical protein
MILLLKNPSSIWFMRVGRYKLKSNATLYIYFIPINVTYFKFQKKKKKTKKKTLKIPHVS